MVNIFNAQQIDGMLTVVNSMLCQHIQCQNYNKKFFTVADWRSTAKMKDSKTIVSSLTLCKGTAGNHKRGFRKCQKLL